MDFGSKINYYFYFILLFIMLFPSLFSWAAPFILLAFIYAILFYPKRLFNSFNLGIAIGGLFLLFLGIVVISINIILFNDYSQWTFWIAGIAVWFCLIVLLRTFGNAAFTIHHAIVSAGLVTGFFNLLYIILFLTGIVTENVQIRGFRAYFGIDPRGFFAYTTTFLPLTSYIVPYLIYKAYKSDNGLSKSEKIALMLLTVTGVLSLRIAVIICIFVSFLIYILHYLRMVKNKLILAIALLSILLASAVPIVGLTSFSDVFSGIYHLKLERKISGEDPRYKQLKFWINSYLDSPLIGHGLSSAEIRLYNMVTKELIYYRPGPIKSDYGYEIFFAKLLSDIGSIFFLYILVFLFLTFWYKALSPLPWQVRALRLAAIFALAQSATNSYMGTSGWLFVLMLPIVFTTPNPNDQIYPEVAA